MTNYNQILKVGDILVLDFDNNKKDKKHNKSGKYFIRVVIEVSTENDVTICKTFRIFGNKLTDKIGKCDITNEWNTVPFIFEKGYRIL